MLHSLLDKKYHALFKAYIEQETPYHLSEIIGIGGYGIAYLLIHKKTAKKAVLKRLRAKHCNNKKSQRKFQLEITMLKQLQIPNTPSVLKEGQLKNILFYIMDYMEGQTFAHAIFIENQKFSLSESLQITKQLLNIVIAIHDQGIVHRDLRIPNILLKNDQLYIIDFGLAAYLKPNDDLTLIKNPKKAENHCSDLYFIGHFLLFLLYSDYTATQKKEKSWQEELQLPSEVIHYIERLLLIQSTFTSAKDALSSLEMLIIKL